MALLAFAVFVAFAYGKDPAPAGQVNLPSTPVTASGGGTPALRSQAALADSAPHALSAGTLWRWAAIDRPTVARATPSPGGRVVARLKTMTPEGTTNAVLLLQRVVKGGRIWVQARLPILPNNSLGWIPREDVGFYNSVSTHLTIDETALTATLTKGTKVVFRAPIGVGKPGTPTPKGEFYIRNELTKYSSPFYGPVASCTSARSAVLTDSPAGGFVGIHGTNAPELVPGRISHGCIRMHNADILRLAKLMKPGTPLTIR
ncbi:MAG: L,D-transpeptidase [Gaiellaceae bacterium]